MKSSVIVFPGSNCDRDIATALEKMQFKNQMVWHKETKLPKSDLIVVHTEWNDFKSINFKSYLKGRKPIIFDMRNIYSPTKMKQQGFKYFGVGR